MSEKICVAGVGAIGGVLSAMLGQKYADSMSLIARGGRAEALRRNGVVLHSQFYGERVAHPARIAAQASELPVQDYIFVCVKNYSLDQMAENLRPAVDRHTVLIPVMNGVEAGDRLRALFPEAIVCDAVIYTISGANPDYSVTQRGTYTYAFFGSKVRDEAHLDGARRACALLQSAGFDARWSDEINTEIWKKFITNCAFNTMTARHLNTAADIRADEGLRQDAHDLLTEANRVAAAEGVDLPTIVEEKYAFMMEKQPPEATSSMARDMAAGRPLEYDTFSGAVIRKAERHGIDVPVTRCYHEGLIAMLEKKD